MGGRAPIPVADRLAPRLVLRDSGCLEWVGGVNEHGYGRIGVGGREVWLTHRVVWTLENGPIPPGINVLHHCDNPPCAQTAPTEGYPEGHLFLGTQSDNVADMLAKGRHAGQIQTHCKNGHEFSGSITYRTQGRLQTQRQCRTCVKAAMARFLARRRLAKQGMTQPS